MKENKKPKVLIYFDVKELKPIGGPSGYLYNLNEELKKLSIDNIEFLDLEKTLKRKIFDLIPKKMKKIIKKIFNPKTREIMKNVFSEKEKLSPVDLNKYDIIHFHSALSMYLIKDSLINYKGKVVFTTHCPKVSHKEIIEDLTSKKFYQRNKKKLDNLEIIDEYAFDRADYILFPTEESEECYYNTWNKYHIIKEKNKEKYIYLPTGIKNVYSKIDKKQVREKYNIPNDAFVISFVGRHNVVKGYTFLKDIATNMLENEKIYFLIAGKEEPISGLKSKNWVEVGWTDDPYSIVNSSDVFILPNKETYFDLVLLEAMCLGKQIVLTETGGNKYFKNCNLESLQFCKYGDINNAIKAIHYFKNLNTDIGYLNQKLYDKNFTINIFTQNYINILNQIYNKR